MRGNVLVVLLILLARLSNSPVFNCLVSHVNRRVQRGVGRSSAVQAKLRAQAGMSLPLSTCLEARAELQVVGSRSDQLRYQSRTDSVQLAVLEVVVVLNAVEQTVQDDVSRACINLLRAVVISITLFFANG